MVSVINRIGMLAFLTAALLSDPLLAMEDEGGGDQRSRPRIRARRKATAAPGSQPKLTDPTLIRMVGVYQKSVEESTKRVQEADAHTQGICKTITELLQRIDEASKNYASYENILQTPNYPQDLSARMRVRMEEIDKEIREDEESIRVLRGQQGTNALHLKYKQQERCAKIKLCFAESIANLINKTLRGQCSIQGCMDAIIVHVPKFTDKSFSSFPDRGEKKDSSRLPTFWSMSTMAVAEAELWHRPKKTLEAAEEALERLTNMVGIMNTDIQNMASKVPNTVTESDVLVLLDEMGNLHIQVQQLEKKAIELNEQASTAMAQLPKVRSVFAITHTLVGLFRALEAKDDRLIHDALEKLLNLSSWRTVANNTQTSAAAASSASSSSAASSSSSSAASSS